MLDMINGENLPGYKKNLLQFIVTEHIIDAVKRSVLECGKRFVKIAFVGLDKKSKRRLKNELKGKGFVVNFLEALEDAKQWLL